MFGEPTSIDAISGMERLLNTVIGSIQGIGKPWHPLLQAASKLFTISSNIEWISGKRSRDDHLAATKPNFCIADVEVEKGI
jgi:hypothetical protein